MANATELDVLGKFVWYDQMSNDLPGSEKFYSKVVGWDLAPNTMNSQKYTLLKAGENMVGGLMPIPEDAAKMGARPAWMGYIAVDDVKKYADKVKAAGGAIRRPPTEIPNVGTFAVAVDPSGAGFLLFKGDGGEAPMQDPMKPGHIGWHELHGGDPEKSFAFYSGLFGWTKSPSRTGSTTSPSTRSTRRKSESSLRAGRSSTGRWRFRAEAGSSTALI